MSALSLNLSNREFWSPRLLDHLDLVLKQSGVLPERLALEITEGVIIDNLDRALVVLHELHARGLEVHVDDFGTGYSSLQALHRLPIDALKIDKSFVAGLGHDERTAELVRTIIQLGNNLGVQVIAEGVETPGQHYSLRQLGCGCGQGYLFSPPVPGPGLEHLITSGRFRAAGARAAPASSEPASGDSAGDNAGDSTGASPDNRAGDSTDDRAGDSTDDRAGASPDNRAGDSAGDTTGTTGSAGHEATDQSSAPASPSMAGTSIQGDLPA